MTDDGSMPQTEAARRRRDQVREYKRSIIRDSAQRVFAAHGIDRASMRQIAETAGWTTGALYQYFASKEELYAFVLRHSLDELHAQTSDAASRADTQRAIAALTALWDYYCGHPDEFNLGFYLYNGAHRRGLTRELNDELNERLDATVRVVADALVSDGLASAADAHRLGAAHTTAVFGLVLMTKTGRLASIGPGYSPDEVLDAYFAPLRGG